MEYTKQTWTAPTGTGLSRYAKSGETDTHVELALDPVNLTNSPTPFTMARMAHMEEGIAKAYDTAPPTPWAQYSGKDIPQLPDNVAGTTYKRDNDWTTTDGWEPSHASITLSVEDETLKVAYDGTRPTFGITIVKSVSATGKFIKGRIKCTEPIVNVQYHNGTAYVPLILATPNAHETDFYGYIQTSYASVVLAVNAGQLTAKTCWISQLYIGTGAYDRLVFDNSYHYRHLLNNAVVPTPQGLYFNGTTSYLRSKEPVTLPDVFTFSATVNCAVSSSVFQRIFETESIRVFRSANTTAISVQYYNTNTASPTQVYINNFFIDNTDIDTKIEIDFISEKIKVYRNNTLFYSGSVPYIQKPTESYLYIGATESLLTNYFIGYMRNIQLYDTSLTDTQRNWLAQGNTPPILYDVTNYETDGYVRIQDADGTNTGVETDVDSNGNRILKLPATIKANVTGNADTATKLSTPRKIDSIDFDGTQDIDVIQPGTIFATVSDTADTGYLLCHGTAVSRTTYARLFNKIGIKFGAGNGSTTFNLPDFREVTLVGAGTNVLNASAISVHDTYTVGQFKDDQIEEHQHIEKVNKADGSEIKGVMPRNSNFTSPPVASDIVTGNVWTGRSGTTTHGKQIGINYQIKY